MTPKINVPFLNFGQKMGERRTSRPIFHHLEYIFKRHGTITARVSLPEYKLKINQS